MSIDYSALPLGKGKTRKQIKARKDREDAKALRHFRHLVWEREAINFASSETTYAYCQHCGCLVARGPNVLTGEVHHRISRRHKEHRYDPDNGVLLCVGCHRDVTEKRITV